LGTAYVLVKSKMNNFDIGLAGVILKS